MQPRAPRPVATEVAPTGGAGPRLSRATHTPRKPLWERLQPRRSRSQRAREISLWERLQSRRSCSGRCAPGVCPTRCRLPRAKQPRAPRPVATEVAPTGGAGPRLSRATHHPHLAAPVGATSVATLLLRAGAPRGVCSTRCRLPRAMQPRAPWHVATEVAPTGGGGGPTGRVGPVVRAGVARLRDLCCCLWPNGAAGHTFLLAGFPFSWDHACKEGVHRDDRLGVGRRDVSGSHVVSQDPNCRHASMEASSPSR